MSGQSGGGPVEVAAAVILRADRQFLLARRPAGRVYEGYWEFPGGKVERAESIRTALARELREELAITITCAYPWITREYVYPHAHVRLNFFRVVGWVGEPISRESQALSWQSVESLSVAPLLPANGPIVRALALPPVLAITDASERGERALLAQLDRALERGLRMVMVREKQMPEERLHALASAIRVRCKRYGALMLVNGDDAQARDLGADGVHLTAARLMAARSRPDFAWCGASCHDEIELAQAAELQLDYALLGPVRPTRSKPAAVPIGWERLGRLLQGYPLPVYALGGMQLDDLRAACMAGAHGVAMIRGAWSAPPDQSFPSGWLGSDCASGMR
ncbi:MAG TPA: Nudix family hydrolase [Burkholderiales bacterium]|nr:Nudix family hydrolase [Burkholderiales bacterium]